MVWSKDAHMSYIHAFVRSFEALIEVPRGSAVCGSLCLAFDPAVLCNFENAE